MPTLDVLLVGHGGFNLKKQAMMIVPRNCEVRFYADYSMPMQAGEVRRILSSSCIKFHDDDTGEKQPVEMGRTGQSVPNMKISTLGREFSVDYQSFLNGGDSRGERAIDAQLLHPRRDFLLSEIIDKVVERRSVPGKSGKYRAYTKFRFHWLCCRSLTGADASSDDPFAGFGALDWDEA